MIVVDTNVLVYLLLPTPHAAQADAILLKDPDWIAPALIHSEFRNVPPGGGAPQGHRSRRRPHAAGSAMEVITVPEGGANGRAVLSLALASGCSAYDCEFVWLARDLRVPLVTADRQVLAACRTRIER